ncbi:MAG: DUF3244 domain-containing protein [Bacteroidales bacterium]|nr:DUF3244 domain-containing protein [Bacteroidales bacterium]
MITKYFKTTVFTIVCTILPILSLADEKEMPDNYKPINVSAETPTNPHRSLTLQIDAYYCCKTINVETDSPEGISSIQIMNVNKGMIKTEYLQPGDKDAAIDIREMGLGNYIICITIGNKVYTGNLELY